MKTPIETMQLVWPTGIPPQDYGKVVRLVAAQTEAEAVLAAPQVVAPPAPPKPTAHDKVIEALKAGNATLGELSNRTGLTVGTLRRVLKDVGQRVGDRPNALGIGVPATVYGLRTGAPQTRTPVRVQAGPHAIAKVKACLSTGPATAKEIAEATGLSGGSVYAALSSIGKAEGYRKTAATGAPAALYVLRDAA